MQKQHHHHHHEEQWYIHTHTRSNMLSATMFVHLAPWKLIFYFVLVCVCVSARVSFRCCAITRQCSVLVRGLLFAYEYFFRCPCGLYCNLVSELC